MTMSVSEREESSHVPWAVCESLITEWVDSRHQRNKVNAAGNTRSLDCGKWLTSLFLRPSMFYLERFQAALSRNVHIRSFTNVRVSLPCRRRIHVHVDQLLLKLTFLYADELGNGRFSNKIKTFFFCQSVKI